MGVCYLVGAGDFCEKIEKHEGDLLIAADGGYAALEHTGAVPDLILGDFDSAARPSATAVPCLTFPREKDETDIALALSEGEARGYREFYIFGALGGPRPDHTVANLQLLLSAARRGLSATLVGGGYRLTVLPPATPRVFSGLAGYLSLFAIGGPVHGLTLTGARYPLENATLTPDVPLGVSNEFLPYEVTRVSHSGGFLLLAWQEKWNGHP